MSTADEPRENLFVRRIPTRVANVVEAVLAEVARLEGGGDWTPLDDTPLSAAINRSAKAILEAIRINAGGV